MSTNLHCGVLLKCYGRELLSTLFRVPLPSNNEDPMWTLQDVDMAGQSFLTWLHEIRHRGTFSHISNAFSRLVEIVKRDPSLKPLCYSWLKVSATPRLHPTGPVGHPLTLCRTKSLPSKQIQSPFFVDPQHCHIPSCR